MSPLRLSKTLIILLLTTILLAACGTVVEEPIPVRIALTQTAAAQETADAAPAVTEEPPAMFEGSLQPLDSAECDELASTMSEMLEVPVEQRNVAVEFEGKSGGGCQATGVVTGADFADMLDVEAILRILLNGRGMVVYQSGEACLGIGGWGPGANVTCYSRGQAYCGVFVHVDPVDPSLCPDDEPITVCLEGLAPEQVIYTVDLTCSQDTSDTTAMEAEVEDEPVVPEPYRLSFATGDESISVWGQVAAGGYVQYVLTVMEGQEMTVNLLDTSGQPVATDTVALAIWGADGTVLISSAADALSWTGELPATQDYYIDVKSSAAEPMAYILEIIIPPPSPSGGDVFPKIEPFVFGEMQSIVLSGVPPMLPPEFPIEEGQPLLMADIITSDVGIYEIDVQFTNCQPDGPSGACHYGSAAGMQVDSTVPVGTPSFPFDIAEAQTVELQYGLTGYFIEGACGASCDDSRIWWIYGGYQYMLGVKGAPLNNVVNLANAAIVNSVP